MHHQCAKLIDIFDNFTKTERELIARSKKDLTKGNLRSRIFDSFPALLPENEIKELCVSFLEIIVKINKVRETEESITLTYIDKKNVSAFLVTIAEIGCQALLNQKLCINKEIMEALDWDVPLNKEASKDILLSYVSAIIQAIVSTEMFLKISANLNNLHLIAVITFINQAYENAIDQCLKKYTPSFFQSIGIAVGGVTTPEKIEPTFIELQTIARNPFRL